MNDLCLKMSLLPSYHQFYQSSFLDSFQSSLSRFNGYHKQFFRYGSSIPFKKYNFYITQKALNDISASEQNPQRKTSFEPRKNNGDKKPISQTSTTNDEFSKRSTWIKKWNETQKPNVVKKPQVVLDYRNGGDGWSSDEDEKGSSLSTGNSTMEKIVDKLKKFGYVDEVSEKMKRVPERGSVEDIFYVEEGMLPNSRGGFSLDNPLGVENSNWSNEEEEEEEVRFPWEKPVAKVEDGSVRRKSRTSLAELTLPDTELKRLRDLAIRTRSKTKITGAGVTQAVVDMIHEKWQTSEIVRLKCEGPPALNMKRMHEILERKTGGLVIWRSGSSLSLYRGVGYELLSHQLLKKHSEDFKGSDHNPSTTAYNSNSRYPIERGSDGVLQVDRVDSRISKREVKDTESLPKYEHEINKLLDGLGPRYTDWPGPGPLPVDADLLPPVVPGYKKPFRLLPYAVRPTIGVYEATALRRVARKLPPHFAIGRSRQHQGLAMAMIKLWESSSIAKIAFKRGVLLTTSQRMAQDMKVLTGGTLVTMNKSYMVFYRGKDFLTPEVTNALLERESLVKSLQDEEEEARLRASSLFSPSIEATMESGTAGTLSESLEADARWGKSLNDKDKDKAFREAELQRHATLVRKLEHKLKRAERKLYKAEQDLAKVEAFLKPSSRQTDPESITDEERFMFRKVGLKMKAYLLLGRRGVFDGTIENMHLHWKYRELVKVFVNVKTFEQVRHVALALEAESGGILVSVDKISKGFAVVVYRGKDYTRPPLLRPKNLLTKRKALARSIELQRHEALFKHATAVKRGVEKIKSELDRMELVRDQGDEELYAELDSAYSSEEEDNGDEDNEDESDEAYLQTYNSNDEEEEEVEEEEEEDGTDESIHNNLPSETNFPFDQDQTWESDPE